MPDIGRVTPYTRFHPSFPVDHLVLAYAMWEKRAQTRFGRFGVSHLPFLFFLFSESVVLVSLVAVIVVMIQVEPLNFGFPPLSFAIGCGLQTGRRERGMSRRSRADLSP